MRVGTPWMAIVVRNLAFKDPVPSKRVPCELERQSVTSACVELVRGDDAGRHTCLQVVEDLDGELPRHTGDHRDHAVAPTRCDVDRLAIAVSAARSPLRKLSSVQRYAQSP